ncbi:conserved hypothetical protein [Ancylobacter novellus DSM 506]|uniref:Amidoligase enzyme n=1 Tax=Ancylobacter novellus (strain ATCC 8093 / DSM 506 / JCM 20403 / CCM 1077 / IAM 12100 / NBRC 12443 / NCIMB 10456) TaxID=639283 RepID=D7A1Z9_ANCN5|nr:amidoligase family protein [Ancylobacter novellus]ADH87615.1 conserved hypothetical protein [Ancylobacter novellus DSM 506]
MAVRVSTLLPATAFLPLPVPLAVSGQPRRVGVEVEFTRLSERRAAERIAREMGGTLREEDPHAFHIIGSRLGDLCVELDMRHAHPHRDGHPMPRLRPHAGLIGAALRPFVPRELVTGPILPGDLGEMDDLVRALREEGAGGDGATVLGSLGLHFNIVPASLEPSALLAMLRAFLLSEPRLRAQGLTGLSRLHAPPPYPQDYVDKVLGPGYRPDLEALCDDYVGANPTRSRALDLLPLFLELFPERVAPRISGKVKPRAALHYRLPVARVGRPGWSLAEDWNRWVEVERLAADPSRLAAAVARHRPV